MKPHKIYFSLAIVCIVLLILFGCAVTNMPDHQEQATLTCYIKEADNRAILKLHTISGKDVVYYNKMRGIGIAQWKEGDKYTVHFNAHGNVVYITRNF